MVVGGGGEHIQSKVTLQLILEINCTILPKSVDLPQVGMRPICQHNIKNNRASVDSSTILAQ